MTYEDITKRNLIGKEVSLIKTSREQIDGLIEGCLLESLFITTGKERISIPFYEIKSISDKSPVPELSTGTEKKIADIASNGNPDIAAEYCRLAYPEADVPSTLRNILESCLNSNLPVLSYIFAKLVKENTLPQLEEHFAEAAPYISYSKEEERARNEIADTRRVDFDNPLSENVVIKMLYTSPRSYNLWNYYLLLIKNSGDDPVLNAMVCQNMALTAEYENIPYVTGRIDRERKYWENRNETTKELRDFFYNYRRFTLQYLREDFNLDEERKSRTRLFFKDISEQRNYFTFRYRFISTFAAKGYIHILKKLDHDPGEYFYIKTARYIATNNNQEEYYYSLFRERMLQGEDKGYFELCRLSIEHGKFDFAYKVASDFCEDTQLYNIQSVFTRAMEVIMEAYGSGNWDMLMVLSQQLYAYPRNPEDKVFIGYDKAFNDKDYAVPLMELLLKCYPDSYSIRNELIYRYRVSGRSEYYEKLYNETEIILEEAGGFDLCKFLELSLMIAKAINKPSWEEDVLENTRRRSLENPDLICGINAFYAELSFLDIDNEKDRALLNSLITMQWEDQFILYGLSCITKRPGNIALIKTLRQDFFYASGSYIIKSREEGFPLLDVETLEDVYNNLYGNPLKEAVSILLTQPESVAYSFVETCRYGVLKVRSIADINHLPAEPEIAKALVITWGAIYNSEKYGRSSLVSFLRKIDPMRVSDIYPMLLEYAADEYQSPELLYKVKFREPFRIAGLYLSEESRKEALFCMEQIEPAGFINTVLVILDRMYQLTPEDLQKDVPQRASAVRCIFMIINKDSEEEIHSGINLVENTSMKNAILQFYKETIEESLDISDAAFFKPKHYEEKRTMRKKYNQGSERETSRNSLPRTDILISSSDPIYAEWDSLGLIKEYDGVDKKELKREIKALKNQKISIQEPPFLPTSWLEEGGLRYCRKGIDNATSNTNPADLS